MKSIKEKALQLYASPSCGQFGTGDYEGPEVDIDSFDEFVKGANYVLEQIEKELPLDDKCLNDYGKALVWRLKNCIEQLKK